MTEAILAADLAGGARGIAQRDARGVHAAEPRTADGLAAFRRWGTCCIGHLTEHDAPGDDAVLLDLRDDHFAAGCADLRSDA